MPLEPVEYQKMNDNFEQLSDLPSLSAKNGTFYSPHSAYLMNENETIGAAITIDHNMLTAANNDETCMISLKFRNPEDYANAMHDLAKSHKADAKAALEHGDPLTETFKFQTHIRPNGYIEMNTIFKKEDWMHVNNALTWLKSVGGKDNTKFHDALRDLIDRAEADSRPKPRF